MKPSSRMLNGMAGRRPARAALLLVACLLAVPAAAAGDAIPIPPVPATPAKVLAPVALEPATVALSCVAESVVPYVMVLGVAQVSVGVALATATFAVVVVLV